VRFVYDEARAQHALLQPEGVSLLNDTAAEVVSWCDGKRDAAAIAQGIAAEYDAWEAAQVVVEASALITDLLQRRALQVGGAPALREVAPAHRATRPGPVPFGLLAELTYKCPLQCPYCSNPVELAKYSDELDTDAWRRVLDEARELGVLQLHLSGGEPLARRDLVELVTHARKLGLYTNLITSGIGLSAQRLAELATAGLDHVQLSIQDSDPAGADAIAGIRAHERKQAVAALVRASGLPLSINVVLHRHNVERLTEIAHYAAGLGAERLELAHTQYYGWGLLNRADLLPSREQVAAADSAAAKVIAELTAGGEDRIEIVYVRPDYHDGMPKPCMNGWGSRQLVVAPNGDVLPCPAASVIPSLGVQAVRDTPLADIWYASDAFQRFRGTEWMSDPCRSCPRKEIDFGGCRCQAYQLTGDAAATDPVCRLSPDHALVADLVGASSQLGSPATTQPVALGSPVAVGFSPRRSR
jgi:pyrroloquinoline quinone biosynthesis protein E